MIAFQGIRFKSREIELPIEGLVLVSTIKLNEKLLTERGKYVSESARIIDEAVFYFVQEDEIMLTDFELKRILINQIK